MSKAAVISSLAGSALTVVLLPFLARVLLHQRTAVAIVSLVESWVVAHPGVGATRSTVLFAIHPIATAVVAAVQTQGLTCQAQKSCAHGRAPMAAGLEVEAAATARGGGVTMVPIVIVPAVAAATAIWVNLSGPQVAPVAQ